MDNMRPQIEAAPGRRGACQAGIRKPSRRAVTPRGRSLKTESLLMVGNEHLQNRVSLESATK